MIFYELTVMDYPALLEPLRPILPYVAFIMAAFSALRLAKFNLDERQAMGFIGLPTPANALFWGSIMVGATSLLESNAWMAVAVIVMVFISSWLLVSEIPMFALKFKHWGWAENKLKYIFLITSALLLLIFRIPGIALVIAWYVLLSAFTQQQANPKIEG
jgi:CDP-diacylglycerol--serine O-phosphatidyltransferase